MSAIAIGERIRALRQKHGLTQVDLAESVGVSRSAIAQWENGHSSPSADVLVSLAKALRSTTDAILGARAS